MVSPPSSLTDTDFHSSDASLGSFIQLLSFYVQHPVAALEKPEWTDKSWPLSWRCLQVRGEERSFNSGEKPVVVQSCWIPHEQIKLLQESETWEETEQDLASEWGSGDLGSWKERIHRLERLRGWHGEFNEEQKTCLTRWSVDMRQWYKKSLERRGGKKLISHTKGNPQSTQSRLHPTHRLEPFSLLGGTDGSRWSLPLLSPASLSHSYGKVAFLK